MSDEKKNLSEDALTKALDEIKAVMAGGEELVKGHSSRGTATTAVDSMGGEGGSTQVHHTASNSDPGTWAGTGQRAVGENGASDAVDENGTDYKGGAEMVKSVLEAVAAGAITAEAAATILSKGGFPPKKDEDEEEAPAVKKATDCDDDKEDDKFMGKSFEQHAQENAKVSEGFEVSDFLQEFAGVFAKAMADHTSGIKSYIDARISKSAEQQEGFNKSLAGALSNFSEAVAAQGQRVDQIEQAPARGPKSAQGVQAVQKSFATEGGQTESADLSKAEIMETMYDMVTKSLIGPEPLVKLDSTGEIDPQLLQRVVSHRRGN